MSKLLEAKLRRMVRKLSLASGQSGDGPAAEAFPVGAVFISVVNTNPSTLLGYGTWASFGTGRVLIGVDSGDADFNVAEETGGSKTHTLTVNQLPAHNHPVTDPGHVHGISTGTTDGAVGRVDSASSAQAATFNTNSATTGISIGNTGLGQAVNHMPPFIAVHFWKRTA